MEDIEITFREFREAFNNYMKPLHYDCEKCLLHENCDKLYFKKVGNLCELIDSILIELEENNI